MESTKMTVLPPCSQEEFLVNAALRLRQFLINHICVHSRKDNAPSYYISIWCKVFNIEIAMYS